MEKEPDAGLKVIMPFLFTVTSSSKWSLGTLGWLLLKLQQFDPVSTAINIEHGAKVGGFPGGHRAFGHNTNMT